MFKKQVTNFPQFVENDLIPYLNSKVASFQAGQISKFHSEWEKLTSDSDILEMVSGAQILFNGDDPVQHQPPL